MIAPFIGAVSETFIKRHMKDLNPGGTVVIATERLPENSAYWGVDGPVLHLGGINQGQSQGLFKSTLSKLRGKRLDLDSTLVMRFLKQYDVNVVLSEYLDYSLKWLPIAKNIGIQFFAKANGYDASQRLHQKGWRKQYRTLNLSDGVIVPTEVMKNHLHEIGIDPKKIFVIPYGVDVPDNFVVRETSDYVRFITIGRMVPKKGPILILEAFKQAFEVRQDLRLDYYGAGEMMPEARQFVIDANLQDFVVFHGFRPSSEIYEGLRRADIYAQHSIKDPKTGNEEGLPVAILEAMAMGLPVISTRHAGIPEAVTDGNTGYLVDEGDTAAMAEKIIELASNEDKRIQLGRNGWERAKSLFSWERERARLLEVLSLSDFAR